MFRARASFPALRRSLLRRFGVFPVTTCNFPIQLQDAATAAAGRC